MHEYIALSERTLEILERSIETSGQLKGQIELLVRDQNRDHQVNNETIREHSRESSRLHDAIQANIQKLLEHCREMTLKLEMSPFSKLADMQHESDKNFANALRSNSNRLDQILAWTQNCGTKIIEDLHGLSKWAEDNKIARAENIKGRWQFLGIIIANLGTILALILSKLL